MKGKVILALWRLPLYCLVAMIALFIWVDNVQSEDFAGVLSAILLFVVFPLFVFTFIRSIVLTIKRSIEYSREGWPDEVTLPEVEFFKNLALDISIEFDDFSDLSTGMKVRYIVFRVLAVALVIGGIVVALCTLVIIGTLMMIGGVTLWIVANPRSYNESVSGVRMVSCDSDPDIHALYEKLKNKSTPLGTPYLVKMRGFKTDVMVYGPNDDYDMVIVYPATADYFYVSNVCMPSRIEENISDPIIPAQEAQSNGLDSDYVLELVRSDVEAAV